MNLAAQTAAALLEFERLGGRLSDETRDGLVEALADQAGGRVVEVDDKPDDKSTTTKGSSR